MDLYIHDINIFWKLIIYELNDKSEPHACFCYIGFDMKIKMYIMVATWVLISKKRPRD